MDWGLGRKDVTLLVTVCNLICEQAVEQGVSHMWTVSALQQHPRSTFVVDEPATAELKVKTVKYFNDLWEVHRDVNKEFEAAASVTTELQSQVSQVSFKTQMSQKTGP